jgi:hypothetical protein
MSVACPHTGVCKEVLPALQITTRVVAYGTHLQHMNLFPAPGLDTAPDEQGQVTIWPELQLQAVLCLGADAVQQSCQWLRVVEEVALQLFIMLEKH